ncbi:MAG: PilW family protein [Sinobacteraceae bacterium]|nr:PilW family protein [Nevskiaceae bacterium]
MKQRGYSLIELSVALFVALFLLAGFFVVLQGTRSTAYSQSGLAQLQDNERVAMTMLASSIELAGYYPNPDQTSVATALPPAGVFTQPGQIVYGMSNTGIANTTPALGDVLLTRYVAGAKDDVINCQGNSNVTNGAQAAYTNEYAVLQPDPNSPPYLACSIDGGAHFVKLVSNVTNMSISYGINSTATVQDTLGVPVDGYVSTANMPTAVTANAAQWTNVYSVKVKLTFVNPLYKPIPNQPATPGQQATVTFTRVIGLMSRLGVNVANFT